MISEDFTLESIDQNQMILKLSQIMCSVTSKMTSYKILNKQYFLKYLLFLKNNKLFDLDQATIIVHLNRIQQVTLYFISSYNLSIVRKEIKITITHIKFHR